MAMGKGDRNIARIVAAEDADPKLTKTQGTKVFVGDQELTGITRIELVCEVNDVWRARIDLMVQPPADLSATAIIHYPTAWQRIKRWLAIQFG